MDYHLIERARAAEDVAAGLHIFLDSVPHCATDISANISELFAIGSVLRSLDTDLDSPVHAMFLGRIAGDLSLVLRSLASTVETVRNMFARSRYAVYGGRPPYQMLWDELSAELKDVEGSALCLRMEWYRVFLHQMGSILRGDRADSRTVRDLRRRISVLLERQQPSGSYFNRGALDGVEPSPWPQNRQSVHQFSTYPSYASPPISPMSDDPYMYTMPFAPEVPLSPTFSTSSQQTYSSAQTYSTNSSAGNAALRHWATRIFDGHHSVSHFPVLGQPTRCFGRDESGLIEKLTSEGFIVVLELPFSTTPNMQTIVRLYWRPHDHRARLVYLEKDIHMGRRSRYCIPLTSLKIVRTDSSLQLYRARRDSSFELWANLRFPVYERMVLFYSVFVGMKRQDQSQPPTVLEDHFQVGEAMEFSGEIEDHGLLHAFRVYRDRETGCVRFEITPRRGRMTRIPIWTAFVTRHVGARGWSRRADARTVLLRELHPYVFCDGYAPPRGPGGSHELRFTSRDDADIFMERFHLIFR